MSKHTVVWLVSVGLMILVVWGGAACNESEPKTAPQRERSMHKHQDSQGRFTLYFPAHYDTTKHDSNVAFMGLEIMRMSNDLFNEGFNLTIDPNKDLTPGEWASYLELELDRQFRPQLMRHETWPNDANLATRILRSDLQEDDLTTTTWSAFFCDTSSVYILTFSAETPYVDQYEPVFKDMVRKFDLAAGTKNED